MGVPVAGMVVRGVQYNTLGEAANAIPCNPTQLSGYKREHGCSMQEAIEYFVADRDSKTFEGRVWKSVKEYVQYKGLSYSSVVHYRLENQCTWQEAVEHHLKMKSSILALPDGRACTVEEFRKEFGLSGRAFYAYAKSHNMSGMDLAIECLRDKNLLESLRKKVTERSYEILSKCGVGRTLKYVIKCKTCGRVIRIPADLREEFVHSEEFCKSHEYAFKSSAKPSNERYTVGGVSGLSFRAACQLAHCNQHTLRRRKEKTGRSLQDLLAEAYSDWSADSGPWDVNGQVCRTKKECARQLGVKDTTFYTLVRSKGSVQAAIDYYSREALKSDIADNSLLYFEGKPVTAKMFCDSMGVSRGAIRDLAKKLNCTRQEALNRIASCFVRDGDKLVRTSVQFNLAENRYIHIGPVRWSVDRYCEINGLNDQAVLGRMYSGKSADQSLVDVYPESVYHRNAGSPVVKGIFMRRDGVALYLITCDVCGRDLLLTREEYLSHQHAEAYCEEHSVL